MKLLIGAMAVMALLAGAVHAQDNTVLKTERDKLSYSYGMYYGQYLKREKIDLDMNLFMRAVQDVLASKPTLVNDTEMQTVLRNEQQKLRTELMQQRKEAGVKNAKESAAFLAANAKKPGVITLPDGLQYKVLTKGTGPIPKPTDGVTVNYKGTLIDGTEFDSSYKRGQPASFSLAGHLIAGWKEALKLMPVGSKWEVYIPAKLAYADRGAGRQIGPNAALIFQIELLGIKQSPPTPTVAHPVTSDIIKVPSREQMKKGAKIEILKPGQTNNVK
jgi:FKBP-type peptidyl-prolyl cis-trans isomerase FklB